MALGGGTIADVTTKDERATAMSAWMMGPTYVYLSVTRDGYLTLTAVQGLPSDP